MQQTDDCACSDAKIAVRDLTKMYGDLTVLDKVNFTIKRGELVCIVGPTGCGKTTFLNCMSKLTETTSGNIYIDGEVANPRKHNLAFIAVRLRVKKKVQNLNAMWYKEFAKNFATQGVFGHESP